MYIPRRPSIAALPAGPLRLLVWGLTSHSTDARRRLADVRLMREARHGLAMQDGTHGGPEGCRRVLATCEAAMVDRPQWPWDTTT